MCIIIDPTDKTEKYNNDLYKISNLLTSCFMNIYSTNEINDYNFKVFKEFLNSLSNFYSKYYQYNYKINPIDYISYRGSETIIKHCFNDPKNTYIDKIIKSYLNSLLPNLFLILTI